MRFCGAMPATYNVLTIFMEASMRTLVLKWECLIILVHVYSWQGLDLYGIADWEFFRVRMLLNKV